MWEHDYYVYMMTNQSRTTLYTGVTNDLRRRVAEHREGRIKGFTKLYQVNRLVFYERFDHIDEAIDFENLSRVGRERRKMPSWRVSIRDGRISR